MGRIGVEQPLPFGGGHTTSIMCCLMLSFGTEKAEGKGGTISALFTSVEAIWPTSSIEPSEYDKMSEFLETLADLGWRFRRFFSGTRI